MEKALSKEDLKAVVEGKEGGRGMRLVESRAASAGEHNAHMTEGSSSWPDCGQSRERERWWDLWLEGQMRTRFQGHLFKA